MSESLQCGGKATLASMYITLTAARNAELLASMHRELTQEMLGRTSIATALQDHNLTQFLVPSTGPRQDCQGIDTKKGHVGLAVQHHWGSFIQTVPNIIIDLFQVSDGITNGTEG